MANRFWVKLTVLLVFIGLVIGHRRPVCIVRVESHSFEYLASRLIGHSSLWKRWNVLVFREFRETGPSAGSGSAHMSHPLSVLVFVSHGSLGIALKPTVSHPCVTHETDLFSPTLAISGDSRAILAIVAT